MKISNKEHFSLPEVIEYFSILDGRTKSAARLVVYRLKGGNRLPIIDALGQQRVMRADLMKFLGITE